jgi:hypothetical protein
MNDHIPPCFHPIMLLPDRYGGTYSGGQWLAIREASAFVGSTARVDWVLDQGPGGNDLEAAAFWTVPPDWIIARATPEAAVAALAGNGD